MFLYNDDEQELPDFLRDNYGEILKAINDEGYIIEYPSFHSFREIHFEDKVVGFITLDTFPIVPSDLLINECYIIPEYRGNNLLFTEIFELMTSPNVSLYIRNPNKALINVLISNGFAAEFSDNLVVSFIKFVVMTDNIYTNPKIKRFYKKSEYNVPYKANLFDMNLCSILFLDPLLEYVKYSDVFAFTLPRKTDLKKYKLRKKLKRLNESYNDRCYEARKDSMDEIQEFLDDVEERILKSISVENLFGTPEKLTPRFIELLKDFDLTEEDGFKIIKHANKALEEDNLTPRSIKRRVQYLVLNIDDIDNEPDLNSTDCPFCGHSNLDFLEECEYCGQKLRDESYEEEIQRQIANLDIGKILEDFKDEIDFDEIFGGVEIEDDDPLFELKTFYNQYLTAFDFEEIKQHYLDEEVDSIPVFLQNYFDSKIKNEDDGKEKFNTYVDYLCSFFYYYLDKGKYDEALSYIIQLAILSSNDEDIGKGNIIERKPHSINVLFEIDMFLSKDPVFDLDYSFKLAVDDFKADEWLNNLDEVHEVISELVL